MANLRQRQQDILEFIGEFLDGKGYPPSVRDIQEGCSISSTSVVDYNLEALSKMGYLKRSKEISRGIELIGHRSNGARIPLLGSVSAGQPLPVFPQDQTTLEDNSIEVDPSFVDSQTPVFALHVKGDSMIDALIKDGDYVVIRSQEHAETGDMVAAWLIQEEETTLKRFFPEGDKVRLQPENSSMSPIFVDAQNVQIKGRVVGVLRKYK
ncbi:MAG: transcriptional repressor LexA [Dehalococcoidia bacterium]|tara:strand:- start:30 stop:656 length:627 start_codon:yes stop_codon:yes gene_type:complete